MQSGTWRRAFPHHFALSRPRAVPSKRKKSPFCTSPRGAEHVKEHFPIISHSRGPAPCPRRAKCPILHFATQSRTWRRAFPHHFALSRPRAVPSKSKTPPFCSSPRSAEHGEAHFPIISHFRNPAPFPRSAKCPLFALRHAERSMARKLRAPQVPVNQKEANIWLVREH